MNRIMDKGKISEFGRFLGNEEKSAATIEKYIRDIKVFSEWLGERIISKGDVIEYKNHLIQKYKTASVNSMLSSINSFFDWLEWYELKVKTVKCQKEIFIHEERELTKSEYQRLLMTAQKESNKRLYYIMQTICASGIRISELRFITVEAIKNQRAEVRCKGKNRTIFLPKELCKLLNSYIAKNNIKSGPVFVTRNGNPLNRSNIWTAMKKLCEEAGVTKSKVFPHNLRHLFARTFYSQQKDIVRLADILGHSSINTTRIYTVESGREHQKILEKMGLVYMRA